MYHARLKQPTQVSLHESQHHDAKGVREGFAHGSTATTAVNKDHAHGSTADTANQAWQVYVQRKFRKQTSKLQEPNFQVTVNCPWGIFI